MMKVLHKYKNGNVDITLFEDGTKWREWEGEQVVEFPENADVKLTNSCSLGDRFDPITGELVAKSKTCEFCHEQSNNLGKHGNLTMVEKVWEGLPPGVELALGGGDLFAHPDVPDFLTRMSRRGFICNTTINTFHMPKYSKLIQELQNDLSIRGIGVSYRGREYMKILPMNIDYSNVVFHVIIGITDISDCEAIIDWCRDNHIHPKILLLGYKQWGNGVRCYSPEVQANLETWRHVYIPSLMKRNNLTISFDNLAIAQTHLQSRMTEKQWETFYLGGDGGHNLYVDSVKEEFARSSTAPTRYSTVDYSSVSDMLKTIKAE